MMKSAKKIFTLFSFMILFTAAQEVKAQAQIGGGLAYGTEIENVGINLNGTYMVSDNIALAPSFIYFLPKGEGDFKLKWFEIDLNGHYYFDTDGSVRPYALAGLNFSFLTVPVFDFSGGLFGGNFETKNETTTKVGLNLGGGAEFDIDSSIKPFGQLSYSIIDAFGQLVIIAGVRIPIN